MSMSEAADEAGGSGSAYSAAVAVEDALRALLAVPADRLFVEILSQVCAMCVLFEYCICLDSHLDLLYGTCILHNPYFSTRSLCNKDVCNSRTGLVPPH